MINGELNFFCWLVCHLTPMLLMVSKHGWCHFEALECIFHLKLKKIPSVNQLTHNQQNTAFPNIWSTLYESTATQRDPLISIGWLLTQNQSFKFLEKLTYEPFNFRIDKNVDCWINIRPILALKVSKEAFSTGLRDSVRVFFKMIGF